MAARLQHLPLAALYATKLQRTRETAATAALLGCAVDVDPDLHEVHLGAWEGGLFRRKVAGSIRSISRCSASSAGMLSLVGKALRLSTRASAGPRSSPPGHPDTMIAAFVHGGVIAHLLHLATGSERCLYRCGEWLP